MMWNVGDMNNMYCAEEEPFTLVFVLVLVLSPMSSKRLSTSGKKSASASVVKNKPVVAQNAP